jgi:hypothetical protein
MEQSPYGEAYRFSTGQEIPRILRNPKVHYRLYKSPPLFYILIQINQIHSWRSRRILSHHPRNYNIYNFNVVLQVITYIIVIMNCNFFFLPLRFTFLTSTKLIVNCDTMLFTQSFRDICQHVLNVMYVLEPLQITYHNRRYFSHDKKKQNLLSRILYMFDLTACSVPLIASG